MRRHVRFLRRQRGGKIVLRLAVAQMRPSLNLEAQNVARPAVLQRADRVPEAVFGLVELFGQRAVLAPGELCNGSLHKFAVGSGGGEGAHVLEVARRE